MRSGSSFCDFCGSPNPLIAYSTDKPGFSWYACASCAKLIDNEEWRKLADRCLEAHDKTRVLSADDRRVVRDLIEALISDFRSCRPVPA